MYIHEVLLISYCNARYIYNYIGNTIAYGADMNQEPLVEEIYISY